MTRDQSDVRFCTFLHQILERAPGCNGGMRNPNLDYVKEPGRIRMLLKSKTWRENESDRDTLNANVTFIQFDSAKRARVPRSAKSSHRQPGKASTSLKPKTRFRTKKEPPFRTALEAHNDNTYLRRRTMKAPTNPSPAKARTEGSGTKLPSIVAGASL